MPVEKVQMATGADTGGTSVSATLGTAPTEGNFLLACGSSPTLTAGINTGNGWTEVGSGTAPGVRFYRKVAGASESATQTLSFTGQVGDRRMTLFELSGVDLTDPLNSTDTSSGTGVTTLTSPSLSALFNDSAVFVGMQTVTATPTYANTWTNGFTQQSVVGSNHTVAALFDTAAVTAYSTNETWSTSSNVRSYGVSINPANPLRVDLVHASTAEASASTSLALNGGDGSGTSVTAGDLRVSFFATKNGTYPELNTPSGWTGIESVGDTAPAVRAMYHVAGTGEKTGLTLTSTTARNLMVFQYIFTKANQESPIGAFSNTSVSSATQLTVPTVTLEETGAIVVVFAAYDGNITAIGWTNGFTDYAGVDATASAIKSVSTIDSYGTTVSWTTARSARAIALVVKQELTPLVAGDGWGISS